MTTTYSPLRSLSWEARVVVDESSAGLWRVYATWEEYHGTTLEIDREAATVSRAVEQILARKAELDAEFEGTA